MTTTLAPLPLSGDARLAHQREADVGEGPQRAQRHRSCRAGHDGLDDEVDRILPLQRHYSKVNYL